MKILDKVPQNAGNFMLVTQWPYTGDTTKLDDNAKAQGVTDYELFAVPGQAVTVIGWMRG